MLSVCVVWNIFQGALRCPSSVSTWQEYYFSFKKSSLQEQECNQSSGACVSDFKFALQTNLTILITSC